MNINQFSSSLNRFGLSRNNRFEVQITPPAGIFGRFSQSAINDRDLIVGYAEASSLPGISLHTSDVRRQGYGPLEKKPQIPVFQDWTCTFLGDRGGILLNFFHQWMRLIINSTSRNEKTVNGAGSYEVEYKKDFETRINIDLLNEQNESTIRILLEGAYPTYVPDIPLDRGNDNTIMKIPVTFTFLEFENLTFLKPQPNITTTPQTVVPEIVIPVTSS